jgi:hypothetical protein
MRTSSLAQCGSFRPGIFLSLSLSLSLCPPPPWGWSVASNPYLLLSYHVTSPSSFGKKDPFCLATYWVEQSVAYRRLANWDRKFCLVGFPQNCVSVILQLMRARPPPVATSYVSCLCSASCDRARSWRIILSCFIYKCHSTVCYELVYLRVCYELVCHSTVCYELVCHLRVCY